MPPQPLTFINTLPAFIAAAPPVIGVVLLETLHQAQELRIQQIYKIIAQHSHIAQLDLLDVEATLLNIKNQQLAISHNFQGVGRNPLTTVLRNSQGQISRLVLNSTRILNERHLERSIFSAAQQGYEQIRNLQQQLPFPYLATI